MLPPSTVELFKDIQPKHVLIGAGAALALAGAAVGIGIYGESDQHAQAPTPKVYDISEMGCDYPAAMRTAQKAINTDTPLIATALRPSTAAVESVVQAQDNKHGYEIINPLALTCRGTITRVIGVDRGFDGQERAKVLSVPVKSQTFTEEEFKPKPNTHFRISAKNLGKYLVKDTIVDNGPSGNGVTGLASKHLEVGYGIMP